MEPVRCHIVLPGEDTGEPLVLLTNWSLSNLVALLRMNLFTHRHLMDWLDNPFTTPSDPQEHPQANFVFA